MQKIFQENILAYDVCFLNEDTVCVLLEDGFFLYRMTEVPELICEKQPEEPIVDLLCVDSGVYVITETAEKKRALSFYDEKGNQKNILNELPKSNYYHQ